MKKLSYVLGLVALILMTTLTAHSTVTAESTTPVSDDVHKLCVVLDAASRDIAKARSMQDIAKTMDRTSANDESVNLNLKLTKSDRLALKRSFMNLTEATAYKVLEFGEEGISQSEIESKLKDIDKQVGAMLDQCKTLGDFARFLDGGF